MKTPYIPGEREDFSHPNANADMAMDRSNAYVQTYWQGNQRWRSILDWKLTILTIASIGSVALGKGLLKGELANYRAWAGVAVHGGLIAGAVSLTDAIRQHRQTQIGWENSTRTQIETAEDLVQRQAERNYNLMGRLDGSSNEVEISIEGLPQPISVEDLAATLAQETGGGTLIISPPGCGKTSLVRYAMRSASDFYNGALSLDVVDCKGDESGWLGIESDSQRFFLLDDDSALEGIVRLEQIKAKLKNVAPTQPTIAVIDEWNNGVSSIQNSPNVSSDDKKRAISVVRQIVTKGRSKKVYGWLTTHTPNTDGIGMDGSTRQGLNVIALARKNKLSMIPSLLKRGGKDAFVDDEDTRVELLAQYKAYVSDMHDDFNPEIPIALTNLGGDWRLVKLPNYSSQALNGFRLSLSSDVDQYLAEHEDEDGNNPVTSELVTDSSSQSSTKSEPLTTQGIQLDQGGELPYAYKSYSGSAAVLRVPISGQNHLSAVEPVEPEPTELELDQQLLNTQNLWHSWDDRQKLRIALLIKTALNKGLSKSAIVKQNLKMPGRKYNAGCWLYDTALEYLTSNRSSTPSWGA